MAPGHGGTKMWLRGCGSYAPAVVQAQHGLCLTAESTFENSGQPERVKGRYMPWQYCLMGLMAE